MGLRLVNVNFQITGNGSHTMRMNAEEVAAWAGVDIGTIVRTKWGLFNLNDRRIDFDVEANDTVLLIFLRPR